MQEQADLLSQIFLTVLPHVHAGDTLRQIDDHVATTIEALGAESINFGYKDDYAKKGFTGHCCLSVNDMIAHGEPTDYQLKDGDTLNIDMGIKYKGLCADGATMVAVGQLTQANERLLRSAKKVLYAAIREVKADVPIAKISQTIEHTAKKLGYDVNYQLVGHRIDKKMHGLPSIPNYYQPSAHWNEVFGFELREGWVMCIEPQIAEHCNYGIIDENGWNIRTSNKKRSAFYEHMVRVEKNGYAILDNFFNEEGI